MKVKYAIVAIIAGMDNPVLYNVGDNEVATTLDECTLSTYERAAHILNENKRMFSDTDYKLIAFVEIDDATRAPLS